MTHVCLGDVAREIKQKVPVDQELPTVGLEHLDPGEVELAHWTKVSRPPSLRLSQRGRCCSGVAGPTCVKRPSPHSTESALETSPSSLPRITSLRGCSRSSSRTTPYSSTPSPIRQAPSRQESSGRAFRNLNSSFPASLSKKILPTYSGPHKKRGLTTGSCLQPAMTSSNHNLSAGGVRHDKV